MIAAKGGWKARGTLEQPQPFEERKHGLATGFGLLDLQHVASVPDRHVGIAAFGAKRLVGDSRGTRALLIGIGAPRFFRIF